MHEPTFMAYELRLFMGIRTPPFMPYEPFLLGVGGGLQYIDFLVSKTI